MNLKLDQQKLSNLRNQEKKILGEKKKKNRASGTCLTITGLRCAAGVPEGQVRKNGAAKIFEEKMTKVKFGKRQIYRLKKLSKPLSG